MNRFILEQYNDNYYRLILEKHADKTHIFDKQTNDKEFNEDYSRECSISRSIRNIRRISHSNPWDYFVTLTIKPNGGCNRYVLDEVIDNIKKTMKAIKRVSKQFKYLLIAEQHPTSGAYHLHGLMFGLPEDSLYFNQYNYENCTYLDNLGFHSMSKIENHNAVCNYITKYISKDICRDSNNRVYWCSRGLSKGYRYEINKLTNADVIQLFGPTTEVVDQKSGEIIKRYHDTPFVAVRDFQLDSEKYCTFTNKDLLIFTKIQENIKQFRKLD